MFGLSAHQKDTLAVIRERGDRGITYRELAARVGLRGHSEAYERVRRLEEKGHVTRTPGGVRLGRTITIAGARFLWIDKTSSHHDQEHAR